jgi:hypothetical protein
MCASKLLELVIISLFTFLISAAPIQSNAASNANEQPDASGKERLVLMPLRVPDVDKNLTGAMETALLEGLQQKYVVFSGEKVSQKAHEIFMKESRNRDHNECDETKCMQNIAMAFQAELIATANVTKQDGSYFLALKIENIFDNKSVYAKSATCKNCDATEVVEKLKVLSGTIYPIATSSEVSEPHPTSKEIEEGQTFTTSWYRQVSGLYSGEIIYSNRKTDRVLTSLEFSNGKLLGSYSVIEPAGPTDGILYDFVPASMGKGTFKWKDRYGAGNLKLKFDTNLGNFNGEWFNESKPDNIYLWTGHRQ